MNRLKILRDEKGLNQVDIGKILGITGQAYGLYENEKRSINNETLLILSEFYNCSIDYLLGKSDIRNPEEINNVRFANAGGLDVSGLDEEEIEEIKEQIEYKRWKKNNENK